MCFSGHTSVLWKALTVHKAYFCVVIFKGTDSLEKQVTNDLGATSRWGRLCGKAEWVSDNVPPLTHTYPRIALADLHIRKGFGEQWKEIFLWRMPWVDGKGKLQVGGHCRKRLHAAGGNPAGYSTLRRPMLPCLRSMIRIPLATASV